MADLKPNECSSTSNVSDGSSGSILHLKIKTLDSRIYNFQVDQNIVVSAFKEKIASESGVPVGQQRLIFRGKVLKDDHLLAAYNVESGDTLHLVERQLQPPPVSNAPSQGATPSNGQASNVGGPRNRIGHVAHGILLGTLNAGDRGEAAVPDIGQFIGAVLNSAGIGNMAGIIQPGVQTQGNVAEGLRGNAGSEDGNQPAPGQGQSAHQPGFQPAPGQGQSAQQPGFQPGPWPMFSGQSAYQAMRIPLGAGGAPFPLPTFNMPIPDSLSTLTDYMNRMEHEFSQNGNSPNQSPDATGDLPAMQTPMNSRGLPTIEAMSIVLRHAQRLLDGCAVPALSRAANRIDQERDSTDPSVRAQVQGESVQLGITMQQLGALFLELGRTVLNFRIGRSSSESFVTAGPAVYISPSGPNPIMVQPFPFQNSLLFGGASGVAPNPVALGPIGMGSVPRNVNIHIHAGASMVPMVPRAGTGPSYGDGANAPATDITLQGADVSPSGATPPVRSSSQDTDPNSISSIVAEINDHLRRSLANANSSISEDSSVQGPRAGSDGLSSQQRSSPSDDVAQDISHVNPPNDQKAQSIPQQHDTVVDKIGVDLNIQASTSSEGRSNASDDAENRGNADGSSAIPLGLGLAGLQPRRRTRQPKEKSKNSNSGSQTEQSRDGPSREIENTMSAADAMSQMLESPALNGLLSGMSQQTGVGSPDILRNMLQQFTQIPALRDTVNNLAQQIDRSSLGGQIDMSRMMQQMMPIVSQALGGVSQLTPPPPTTTTQSQMNIGQVVENASSSEEIFQSVVDAAVDLLSNDDVEGNFVDELCNDGDLVKEFMEMLCGDISRRLQDERAL